MQWNATKTPSMSIILRMFVVASSIVDLMVCRITICKWYDDNHGKWWHPLYLYIIYISCALLPIHGKCFWSFRLLMLYPLCSIQCGSKNHQLPWFQGNKDLESLDDCAWIAMKYLSTMLNIISGYCEQLPTSCSMM